MYASKTAIALGLLLALIGTDRAVSAAERFDPAAKAKTIAPYIDARTIALVRIDLARIEVDGLLDKFVELVPEADYEIERSRAAIVGSHAALLKAGFAEVYMVLSLADLPRQPPFFILPAAGRSDVRAVSEAWPQSKLSRYYRNTKQLIEPSDKAIFVGSARTFERIKLGRPHSRPELADAFRAAGDTALQVLLLPTADHRRVIDELLPTLPREVGGGPSRVLTRGLFWAAMGANTPPEMSFRITIQSADDRAAQALADRLRASVAPLTEHAKAVGMLRKVDRAVAALTPRVDGDRLMLVLDEESQAIEAFLTAVTPPIEEARSRAARVVGTNNLKHLGLAMHNWHDAYKSFPAQANFDATGKPLLSWRVHVLPFLEGRKLYNRFHLDEPWDSPHNRQLIDEMPDVYRSPLSRKGRQGYTSYVMPVHEQTVCPGHRGVPISEIKDGSSNTIMIVEVGDDQAVIWTKPEDLPVDLKNPAKGLGGLFKDGFQAALCDGSAHFISKSIDPKTLRALLTRAGGEVVASF